MKILDIPQSGKIGLQVSQGGRYGQVRRALVIPGNPNTPAQASQRGLFGASSAAWNSLTQAQRDAWIAAANTVMTKSRLGQNGVMTGNQLFTKINTVLATFGGAAVTVPPAAPTFPALAPQNLVITNTAGVIAVSLTCPTDPGEQTIVRASGPVSPGILRAPHMNIIGVCPAPAAGASDITALITARYGVLPVGRRIFVAANQYVDGWESPVVTFTAIVPGP